WRTALAVAARAPSLRARATASLRETLREDDRETVNRSASRSATRSASAVADGVPSGAAARSPVRFVATGAPSTPIATTDVVARTASPAETFLAVDQEKGRASVSRLWRCSATAQI